MFVEKTLKVTKEYFEISNVDLWFNIKHLQYLHQPTCDVVNKLNPVQIIMIRLNTTHSPP